MTDTNLPPKGTDGETLEERLKRLEDEKKQLEREKRGIINDLQSEREKRQEMESRIQEIESTLVAPSKTTPDEVIQEFAKNPNEYIDSRVEARVQKAEKRLMEIQHQNAINEAYSWLAEQEGTTVQKIRGSDKDQEIGRIVKDYGLSEIDPRVGVKSAYKIYLQEQKEKSDRDAKRTEAIQGNSTEPVRATSNSKGMKFTTSQIASMSRAEYEQNRDAILEARSKGLISAE